MGREDHPRFATEQEHRLSFASLTTGPLLRPQRGKAQEVIRAADSQAGILSYAANDAKRFHEVLTTRSNVPTSRLQLIVDEDATANLVMEALMANTVGTHPGALVVVYFSGHGVLNAHGDFFLLAYDSEHRQSARMISMAELKGAILRAPARSRTLFLDTTYSGQATLAFR